MELLIGDDLIFVQLSLINLGLGTLVVASLSIVLGSFVKSSDTFCGGFFPEGFLEGTGGVFRSFFNAGVPFVLLLFAESQTANRQWKA